jgi:hypothetical protein
VGEWVKTRCAKESRGKVYETCLALLTPLDVRNDIVVRMCAATTIQSAVDEWQFEVVSVLPYLSALLFGTEAEGVEGGLVGLLQTIDYADSKAMILRIIGVIIARVGAQVHKLLGNELISR